VKRLIAIVGPTAVGKTALSIFLAEHFTTEIISSDSRQVFKELEIGTAKPSPEELKRVPHHFINTKSIFEKYDAGQYGRDALVLVQELFKKYDTLVLCGGSGLYVKALLEGFDDMPETSDEIRCEITSNYKSHGISWLQTELKHADPDFFSTVDQQNPQRMMRALELVKSSGRKINELRGKKKVDLGFEVIRIGLELPREELYQRINQRMDVMIAKGLFEEATQFHAYKDLNALQTVGYREIFDYLEGKYSKEEAIRLLKQNSRHYAKRQLTWFKRDESIHWFLPHETEKIIQLLRNTSKFEL
jgi:tRNA dimethylallyltransferase